VPIRHTLPNFLYITKNTAVQAATSPNAGTSVVEFAPMQLWFAHGSGVSFANSWSRKLAGRAPKHHSECRGHVLGSVMGGVRSGNPLSALGGGALGLIGGSLAGGLACGTCAIVKSTPQVLHPRDLIYQDDRRTGGWAAH